MNSQVVRTFLSLNDDENEKAKAKSLAVEKSLKKLSNILTKSSSSPSASKNTHLSLLEVQIINLEANHLMCKLERVSNAASISEIKDAVEKKYPQYYKSRQSLRLNPDDEALKDFDTLANFNLTNECILYFQDLGPQVQWSKVFYCEYTGPLLLYLFFFLRPPFTYENEHPFQPSTLRNVLLAGACHTFHYTRRLLETRFVHRFSRGALPVDHLLKNTFYYWIFALWMSFFINHPLYTPPHFGDAQVFLGLGIFMIGELGSISIHVTLRNLSPDGSHKRQVIKPTVNPFTWLYSLVSCPNYTYELLTWIGFGIMTQTVVVLFFTVVGFFQMARWAYTKHNNYRREFPDYPKSRKAILPFVL